MYYVLGLLIATSSVVAVIIHLQQAYTSYYDFVAFWMVLGGTMSVATIIAPWDIRRDFFRNLRSLIVHVTPSQRDFLQVCLDIIGKHSNGLKDFKADPSRIEQRILRDGLELISLGFMTDKIEPILKERVYQANERNFRCSAMVRSLAKYPPAFGLAGTVFGLVHLMRGVSEGMTAEETGVRMAIALVATLYGLMVANLFVNPAGELINRYGKMDERLAELAIQAVLLAADRTPILEAQEMLNSFVDEDQRIDLTSGFGAAVFEEAA
ncbi:MAG: MotA/TolQ/ExbB proton channel family protein [Bdellovibrionaceae bacterium]|nr:MotA/TolQ/ExbB proton channel family protein [Bdellovibrionales bacterium]MCB9083382.1 MotA/TolQ/ExbB proton channel family protein [Pseudobdellovibrionaceae bacterium]